MFESLNHQREYWTQHSGLKRKEDIGLQNTIKLEREKILRRQRGDLDVGGMGWSLVVRKEDVRKNDLCLRLCSGDFGKKYTPKNLTCVLCELNQQMHWISLLLVLRFYMFRAGFLPETCRIVIPIKVKFSASVGFIQMESVTMHGHKVVKFKCNLCVMLFIIQFCSTTILFCEHIRVIPETVLKSQLVYGR